MTNHTVVFPESGEVSVEERDVPDPGPEEVLVRTERTLISTGTELTVLSGDYPEGSHWDQHANYPFEPGYNNVGEVVEVGDGVETVSEGDRVATYGQHAAYVAVDAETCRPVPDAVTPDEAAFFTIAEIVMNGVRRSDLDWGETAVVYGLGLLGQIAARVCHVAGARPVVGADVSDDRVEWLPDSSRLRGVNPTEEDVAGVVEDEAGDLADVVFEVTGNPDVITQELDALRSQGRFVLLSSPRGETAFDFHDYCNAPSYHIIGAHNGSHPPVATPENPWTQSRHARLFFDYVAEGSIDVASLVSHRVGFGDAPELYEMLLEDRTGAMGVLIDW